MSRNYTTRSSRRKVTEVNASYTALRGMLEGFITGDGNATITLLNGIRPLDVVQAVLGRKMTIAEGKQYLEAIDHAPKSLRHAFQAGKIWQDLCQTSRKYLQGTSSESKSSMTNKYKYFLQVLEKGRSRVA